MRTQKFTSLVAGSVELLILGMHDPAEPLVLLARCLHCRMELHRRIFAAADLEQYLQNPEPIAQAALDDAVRARDHHCVCH